MLAIVSRLTVRQTPKAMKQVGGGGKQNCHCDVLLWPRGFWCSVGEEARPCDQGIFYADWH